MKLFLILFFCIANALADVHSLIALDNTTDTVSRAVVRDMYLMKQRRWENGSIIVLYQMDPDTVQHRRFVKDVLNMTPERYARDWERVVNTGLATNIRSIQSSEEMMRRVASTPNGLGYLDENKIVVYSDTYGAKILRIVD